MSFCLFLYVTNRQIYMDGKAEILLIDDHALILEGIQRVLERIPEVQISDTATSGKVAAELINKRDYDVYILDVNLPDISGLELAEMIRKHNKSARIIVNTMHEEVWMVNRLIRQKVDGVVLKSSDAEEIVKAVEHVLQGESYACPRFMAIRQKLGDGLVTAHPKDVPTKRELEVLRAVAKGYNTHEIAKELQISENTVETFRKRLMQKFCAKNAIDLVVKAIVRGWIEMG